MPLYSVQTEGGQSVGMYPIYQGFEGPAYIDGVQVSFTTQRSGFFNIYPNIVQQNVQVGTGNGGYSYSLQVPLLSGYTNTQNPPYDSLIRGHIDMSGIIATGNNIDPPLANGMTISGILNKVPTTSIFPAVYITTIDETGANLIVQDSGVFLTGNVNYGMLMNPGKAPFGNYGLAGGYSTTSNTVNYLTGQINVNFPEIVPSGQDINVQCLFFQSGLPRGILFYNNTLTLRVPPADQYQVQLDAYLSPAAFFNTAAAIPFGYMAEYIARGAARKILSDVGDIEQFMFYEPLFKEQEILVWKRSQRQFTSSRTETIYSTGFAGGGMTANSTSSSL